MEIKYEQITRSNERQDGCRFDKSCMASDSNVIYNITGQAIFLQKIMESLN